MTDKRGTIRSVPNRSFAKKSLETLDKRIDELEDSKADLVNGKVPESQLPSYVDDVINGYLHDGKFYEEDTYQTEITPEEGKIYVDLATNVSYRWTGVIYTPIGIPIEANPTLVGDEPELDGLKIGQQKYKINNKPHIYDVDSSIEGIADELLELLNLGDIVIQHGQDLGGNDLYTTYVVTYKEVGSNNSVLKVVLMSYLENQINEVIFEYNSGTSTFDNTVNNYTIQKLLKSFTNVSASTWVSDSTITGFSYKCELTCTGITSDSMVFVQFGDTEAASGNYSSTVETGENKVTFWSKVNTSITIPLIKEI